MPRMWVDTEMNDDVAVAAQLLVSLLTGVTQSRFDQMTLLRTIIGMDLGRTVHDSGEGSEALACGIGIVSQEAFAAGQVPDPTNALDFPPRGWIWRAKFRTFGFAADQPAVFSRRVDVDLRAMRKLENGHLFIAVDNDAIEGTSGTCRLVGYIRTLWQVG